MRTPEKETGVYWYISSTFLIMKYRKQYTSKWAKDKIELLKCSLGNYQEELLFAKSRWVSPLILALCNQTKEEMIENAFRKIKNINEEIEYCKQFL
jgi:hypothetical protein